MHIWQTCGSSYNYVQHSAPFTDCMPLSRLLKTIKINGAGEFRWCMENSRFSTNIWWTTTVCDHHLDRLIIAYCIWVDDRVGAINNIHWWMARLRISGSFVTETICPYLETPKDITTKSGETHIRNTALPYCKSSPWSARDICFRQKIQLVAVIWHCWLGDRINMRPVIIPSQQSPGGGGATVPCYKFSESSFRANVTPHLTCRPNLPFDIFASKISDFGATWDYPQRGENLSAT